jgi:hypothetical protein
VVAQLVATRVVPRSTELVSYLVIYKHQDKSTHFQNTHTGVHISKATNLDFVFRIRLPSIVHSVIKFTTHPAAAAPFAYLAIN